MSNNKISNKDAELYKSIVEDFNEKPDHETELGTVKNLEGLIFALHALNVVAFCAIIEYFHFQGVLKAVGFMLIGVLGIALESLKRKRAFMYAQTTILAENHPDNNVRQRAYKRSKSQFPMLGVTWAIAVGVAVFSGIGMAHFFVPALVKGNQNVQYENTWKASVQALDVASKENASLAKIKALQAEVEKAKQNYEADKRNVEAYNASQESAHASEIMLYAAVGGAVGLALEGFLFLAIAGLFKKKFEIAESLKKAHGNANFQTVKS